MVERIVRVLVSHRQPLGFMITMCQFFNFVAFCLSDKLFSISVHLLGFLAIQLKAFSFCLFLVVDHLSDYVNF